MDFSKISAKGSSPISRMIERHLETIDKVIIREQSILKVRDGIVDGSLGNDYEDVKIVHLYKSYMRSLTVPADMERIRRRSSLVKDSYYDFLNFNDCGIIKIISKK